MTTRCTQTAAQHILVGLREKKLTTETVHVCFWHLKTNALCNARKYEYVEYDLQYKRKGGKFDFCTERQGGGGAENAGVKNAGATKYGKPSEENILKYQTNICRGFPRPNLFVFLGYMQYITFDSVSDVSRVTRGLAIRRAKKRVNLTNDKRIKMCLQRLDSHE